jgi:hypothetical protein
LYHTEFYEDDESLGKIPMYKHISNPFMKSRTIPKSKQVHECEYCKGKIDIGESCEYWIGKDFGKFYYYRVCNKCTEEGKMEVI